MAHMEKHFRDKLDNYSPKAPAECWDNIELTLDKTLTPKRKVGIWYMAAASIAIIALSATLFTIFNKNNQLVKQEFIAIEKENNSPTTDKNTLNKNQSDKIVLSEKTNLPAVNSLAYTNHSEIIEKENEENNGIIEKGEIPVEKLTPLKPQANAISNHPQPKFSNPGYLAQSSTIYNIENIENIAIKSVKSADRWSVGLDFGPSYSYRYLTSSAKNQESVAYFNTVEDPIQTFTGGINFQYKIFKRLSVQSGIYYAQMGQSIGNLLVYSNKSYDMAEPSYKENLRNSYTLSNSIGDISVNSKYVVIDKTNVRVTINTNNNQFFDDSNPNLQPLDAKIIQNFDYIDIPLFFRYKMVDRKIDFSVIAGTGMSILLGNEVSVIINDAETIIGETKDVRKTNYTANIGFALELPIINNLKFSLEPTFKYHINTLNLESDFEWHPYSFAVISGFCLSL